MKYSYIHRIGWAGIAALTLLLSTVSCGKNAAEKGADEEAKTQDEASLVPVKFEGTFRNEHTLYEREIVTELELTPEGVQQRRDGFVVYDAPCTQKNKHARSVDFDCGAEDAQRTLWPLAFTDDGQLYHRAQPEMRYAPVETDPEPDAPSDPENDAADAPIEP